MKINIKINWSIIIDDNSIQIYDIKVSILNYIDGKKDKKKIFKESKIFYKILDADWQKNNFVEKKK